MRSPWPDIGPMSPSPAKIRGCDARTGVKPSDTSGLTEPGSHRGPIRSAYWVSVSLTPRGAVGLLYRMLLKAEPGIQFDYDDEPMVWHPDTGKYRRTRLIVFTLAYSRKSIRLLTFTSGTVRWAELHEETFRRLGGRSRSSSSTIFARACPPRTSTTPR